MKVRNIGFVIGE
jgi:hypothetical protein